jgi:DNA-directed RNA polymerase specialized sigma24 family protein
MTDNDWLAAAFEEHRGHLRAVAYRLLGSAAPLSAAVARVVPCALSCGQEPER